MPVGGGNVRICARCSGVVLGVLSASLLALLGLPHLAPVVGVAAVLVLAFPMILDFHLQLMGHFHSTNARRMITGFTFASALVLSIACAFSVSLLTVLVVPALLASYCVYLASSPVRRDRLFDHLELYVDYYDRCRVEDIRARVSSLPDFETHNGEGGY